MWRAANTRDVRTNACKTLALSQSELTRGVHAFCTHFSGPERTQMSNRQGADARRDAVPGHIVRSWGPGARALDEVNRSESWITIERLLEWREPAEHCPLV